MTALDIQKKIASILPKNKKAFGHFLKDALFLQLQETNKKIALFEGKYNKTFDDFKRGWARMKAAKKYSYEAEADYFDWEVLEEYKRDLMRVVHSLYRSHRGI